MVAQIEQGSYWTRQHSAEEVMRRLQAHGVRAGVVQHIADLMEHDAHIQARDFFSSVTHTILGDIPISDLPIRPSATPGAYSATGPCLGEHNAYVYGDLLGMTDTDIATYTTQGIFN